ncbi:hypothetical protein ACFOKF_18805 [Sphingobium rhizovicinum]|uniref:YMGG-like Gly-zipper domain-containing protein n=1 Tax=Sphingobium rhizovicinum TaxID=432308 RepID=A0ABV7NJJ1_9SPHN
MDSRIKNALAIGCWSSARRHQRLFARRDARRPDRRRGRRGGWQRDGLGTAEGAIIGGAAGAIIGDKDRCTRKERRRGGVEPSERSTDYFSRSRRS